MNKKLNAIIDAHRTAIEMAAKKRNIPQLAHWFYQEYVGELEAAGIADTAADIEVLAKALIQFYQKGAK